MMELVLKVGGLFLVIFLLEIALFWASTALGNVEISLAKLLAGALAAAVLWAGAIGTLWHGYEGRSQFLDPEQRWLLVSLVLGFLAGSWLLQTLLFVPVLPVSLTRGMMISVFQLLLRLFLYTLVGAVIMVVLAILQIR